MDVTKIDMMSMIDIMWPIKPITLSCILFMLIEIKFIHYHSCVIFIMNSMFLMKFPCVMFM